VGPGSLVLIFLATLAVRQQSRTITFSSALEMLTTFGMQQVGSQYRRLIGAFQRSSAPRSSFGSDISVGKKPPWFTTRGSTSRARRASGARNPA
jgi:hypothetical protein